jgi:hypothetical protein
VTAPALREAFERAVHRQLMTDVPYGVLLSGASIPRWLPRVQRGLPASE